MTGLSSEEIKATKEAIELAEKNLKSIQNEFDKMDQVFSAALKEYGSELALPDGYTNLERLLAEAKKDLQYLNEHLKGGVPMQEKINNNNELIHLSYKKLEEAKKEHEKIHTEGDKLARLDDLISGMLFSLRSY